VQAAFAGTTAAAISCGARNSAGSGSRRETYQERFETPVVARHQVVVAGGGPSGVIAALAAARSGADTLLIERYGFLGGNGTAGLMTCYNGFRNQRPPEALQTVKGIPAEYIAEIVRLGGVADMDSYEHTVPHDVTRGDIPYTVPFDPEAAKVASLNMIKKEGVKLRLHSWVVAPMLDGSRVTGEEGTGDRMSMSLMYRLGGLPASIKGPYGGIRIGDRVVKWGPRFGGDGLDVENLTRAEAETRLQLWDRVQQLRRKPGMESLYLMQTATNIGVRETRRIIGEHILTEQEAIEGVHFPDVVAISSNPMPSYHGRRYFFRHEGFDIPYRSLVPKKVEGLLLAGRCISCEQAPFQSARSMAPAMAIGHASGCAAALAATGGVPPRKLDVKALQKLLLSQNAELRL